MDLEKTSIILKKINRLYELMNGIGEASSTEKDLLKAYVIDLYEAVAMSEISDIPDLNEDDFKKKIKKQKKAEKKLSKQVDKKKKVSLDEDADEELVEQLEEILPEVQVEEETVEVEPTKPSIDPSILELFNVEDSSELSDRLANAPIKDLTKAMGINEKIFTVNELFDGNLLEMDNMLDALNGLSSFDEAASILQHSVASKYQWSDPSKLKKAKKFIRLIKRRFN